MRAGYHFGRDMLSPYVPIPEQLVFTTTGVWCANSLAAGRWKNVGQAARPGSDMRTAVHCRVKEGRPNLRSATAGRYFLASPLRRDGSAGGFPTGASSRGDPGT